MCVCVCVLVPHVDFCLQQLLCDVEPLIPSLLQLRERGGGKIRNTFHHFEMENKKQKHCHFQRDAPNIPDRMTVAQPMCECDYVPTTVAKDCTQLSCLSLSPPLSTHMSLSSYLRICLYPAILCLSLHTVYTSFTHHTHTHTHTHTHKVGEKTS